MTLKSSTCTAPAAPPGRQALFFSAEYLVVFCPLVLWSQSAHTGLIIGCLAGLLLLLATALNYWIFASAYSLQLPSASVSLKPVVITLEFIVLIIFACCAQLLVLAYHFPLYQASGWIAPALALHSGLCIHRLRATDETFTRVMHTTAKASLKIATLLICLGALVEVLSSGTLFTNKLPFLSSSSTLMVISPAAVLLLLALVAAARNLIRPMEATPTTPKPSGHKRVRTTGHIK